jgi:hypothetical protein
MSPWLCEGSIYNVEIQMLRVSSYTDNVEWHRACKKPLAGL